MFFIIKYHFEVFFEKGKYYVFLGNSQTLGLKNFGHILLRHFKSTQASSIYWPTVVVQRSLLNQVVFIMAITVGIQLTFCCRTSDVSTLVGMTMHII